MAEMEKSYDGTESAQTHAFMSGTLGATGASQFQMLDTKQLGTQTGPIFLNNPPSSK
jgi:hypothetical protein